MSRPTTRTYKTKNWPSYNEALKRRGSLAIWFDPGMGRAPSGKRGWRQSRSDAANPTCLTMKVLFGVELRQTTGFIESLLRLIEPDWRVPDFSTLCRRRKILAVTIPYRGSKGPPHLLIDSTGIKVEGDGEWNAHKHPSHRNRVSIARQWVGPNGASGARYTSESTRKRWRSERSRSPGAISATPRCYPNYLSRSPPIRKSAASQLAGPETPGNATIPSRIVAPPWRMHR